MPCIAKGESIGGIYHVINRDYMKIQVFDDAEILSYGSPWERQSG